MHRGQWAGDRFMIITVNDFDAMRATEPEEEWDDTTEFVVR
jgi:hypothetical protein